MIRLAVNINFRINPENLHVYSNMNVMGNTTGVEQPTTVYFYKHSMPPASLLPLTSVNENRSLDLLPLTLVNGNCTLDLLPLTSVNGKEAAPLTTGLQPHSMWLKPVTFMKSANRQLKQTAIKQTACPDFSGQQSREGRKCGSMRMKEKEQKGREQDAGFLSLDT